MEILVVAALIALNGIFAMSEIAVVASRPARLQRLAHQGVRAAGAALALHNAPNTFLSTIQVGITLIGVLLGAIGEAALADDIALLVQRVPSVAHYSEEIALGIMVVIVTYFSLVIGELVPKRLALLRPERIACVVAPPMKIFARIMHPAVRLLSASVDTVLRLLRARPSTEPSVTEEEIYAMIDEGARTGVLHRTERELLKNVMRFADRGLHALLRQRDEIVWLDLNQSPEENRRRIITSPHTRFPVAHGNLDRVIGVVQAKEFLAHVFAGGDMDLDAIMRPALKVAPTTSPLRLLEMFRASPVHMALIVSAAGEVRGLITLHDVLEAMVGALPVEGGATETPVVRREDGSFLLDGMVNMTEFKEILAMTTLPEDATDYDTVAGFVLAHLDRVPQIGDRFEWGGWRFEIVDMDNNRIDRVLAVPLVTSK